MAEHRLLNVLTSLRRRLLGVSLGGGLAWGLVAAILLLVACAWVDLAVELPSGVRLACLLAAGVLAVALLGWTALTAFRQGSGPALARRLDATAGTGGQILAGVDLFHQYRAGIVAAPAAPLSGALAQMAVERAARLADGVRAAAAVPLRPLYWPISGFAVILIALLLLAVATPRIVRTQWLRFTEPFGDHPPYSAIDFKVQPGDARVLYGGALDVRVTAEGGTVEQLDLVLLPSGAASVQGAGEQVLPMFPEPGGAWRATVAEVTRAGRYFVRTRGSRSRRFAYDVITVPEIREVKFRVTPPAYTRRPPYEGPLPQGGIAGLAGTKVDVWVKSNRPLSGGAMRFAPSPEAAAATQPATRPAAPADVALAPASPGASEVTGAFTIRRGGKLELAVTDVSGQGSLDSFSAPLHVLHDDRPFVRMLEPRPQSYATPDVTLNVSVLAEDDYGVARVQLFRSLNDSRPLAVEGRVPQGAPTRVPVTFPLKLGEYGLQPGDVIRLFARVEDTDPLGPKGSESSIVTVQIISREDLNRMTLAREGLEVLQSKYEQARRRLETLDAEIQKHQQELAKLEPGSEVSKQKQKELEDLAQEVMKAADDIAKNAGEDLPFDIDRKLRQSLYDLAADVRDAGRKFDHAAGQLGLSAADGNKAIDELRKRLGTKREEFEKEATDPLEHLAKIFPLKEDEARFADLYQRQRDLAERMEALKGQAGDDPGLKARMRDLEAEQRQLREELRDLLDDIDDHLAGLPDDPRLDDLRKTAGAFAKALRESDAAQQMNSSETALSEFKGGDAAQKAKEAADTLEKFLAKCQGMGEQAAMCLKFSPQLESGLGNTVEQLLQAEGLGTGVGKGAGAGGGYSARRSTLKNVGLYGSMPAMNQRPSKSGSGRDRSGAAARSTGDAPDGDAASGPDATGRLNPAGETGTNIPPRYRRKVGEYFQRVADELGE